MKVLVACEFSGTVREAFKELGHDAWSCDLLPTDIPGNHIQDDVLNHLNGWDLIIAHPPCTYLTVSNSRNWAKRRTEQLAAIEFVLSIYNNSTCPLAIENPIGRLSTAWRKPDQIIQPWMFGHGETKSTCLWLRALPKLQPTNIVNGRQGKILSYPPSPDRWKIRSKTYQGIADAMASQWSNIV